MCVMVRLHTSCGNNSSNIYISTKLVTILKCIFDTGKYQYVKNF